eukprot:CAMPEP_0117425960 /NCGR_PEP_ID=MMETSP0758-20121206/6162_1 /TAXON_ID=63605 /ORGANISM="Percolomonas cosmopolitus, Strain AE-1 (ATCC 50343)" /LENGTH=87 /DNA_ID=CAMNT_0005210827 /DNA_START=250 /DNA_END=510 /DNA_ORIENTATION=-
MKALVQKRKEERDKSAALLSARYSEMEEPTMEIEENQVQVERYEDQLNLVEDIEEEIDTGTFEGGLQLKSIAENTPPTRTLKQEERW